MAGTYDDIARFYDVDMARNMPFDDVAFYADLCARHGGRVLELGCGNGRIMLQLLQRGIDAVGVDASAGMLAELRRKAAARELRAPVARMDVTRLALRPGFGVILCPYSLITYIIEDADLARLMASARRLLDPGGVFVVDAFVPKAVVAQQEFQADYRRPFGAFTLARSKRIRPAGPGRNRIERRYRVLGADDEVVEQVDVAETIRPVAPDALRALLAAAGFEAVREWWDYGASDEASAPQFFTIAVRPAAA
jgi:SAM-dependent methyltransferase